MNACLRAVVRTASTMGVEVVGVRHGYQGLLDGDFYESGDGTGVMSARSVSHIIQHGGTILRTGRCDEFRTASGVRKAADTLVANNIDGLVVIGGDGSLRGAIELGKVWSGRIVGCPGTIDNDLAGTDYTIGFLTAVATAVEAIDKLRDTAESHERLFLVEVMGRGSGYLALFTALASGAEFACIPETPTHSAQMVSDISVLKKRGKASIIVVVAEGDDDGGIEVLRGELEAEGCPYPLRSVKLGHVQRGGSPTPADRILASEAGDLAARALIDGKSGVMAGRLAGQMQLTPFAEAIAGTKTVPLEQIQLLKRMSV